VRSRSISNNAWGRYVYIPHKSETQKKIYFVKLDILIFICISCEEKKSLGKNLMTYMCCSHPRNRGGSLGKLNFMATHEYTMFKIGHSWAIIGGWVGPLGARPSLHKPNVVGAYLDHTLSLLESHVWICGNRVYACSKSLVQVGGFFIHCFCTHIIVLFLLYCKFACLSKVFFGLKINHVTGCNDCAFILGLDAKGNSILINSS
jgi:hypothetical protein